MLNSSGHFRELRATGAEMASSRDGREFLTYLVSCALPSDQGAYAIVQGQRHKFAGSLGLAPGWLDRPLTESEQRWVSAGILARSNHFGKHVEISMRNPDSGFASLEVSDDERKEFTLCEGDFFGNLFVDPPVACVAVGPRTERDQADPILQLRVGTEVDQTVSPVNGKPVSRCGFLITGPITAPDAHSHDRLTYREFIRVFLTPGTE